MKNELGETDKQLYGMTTWAKYMGTVNWLETEEGQYRGVPTPVWEAMGYWERLAKCSLRR